MMTALTRNAKFSKLRKLAEEKLQRSKRTKKLPKSTPEIIQLFHELQVHQVELELQNQELQETYAQLENELEKRLEDERLARVHQLELTQVARSNSMGELASAIAHEINQPLAIIVNYVNGCVRRLESKSYNIAEILDAMRQVARQAELAGTIMHHMKNIVRQDESYYKQVSINDIVLAAISQLQKEVNSDLSLILKLKLGDALSLVNADHIQIELVILNLLRNCLESVKKAKVIKPELVLRTEQKNNMIIVNVIDNGPHYSLEEEARLFEPTFTTKKNGMGMGLSISRTIVEAHSGHLSSYKMPVIGVCFQFSLPIVCKKHES